MVSGLNQVIAQNVFNKIIDDPTNGYPLGLMVDDSRYVIYELGINYTVGFATLDTLGNLVERKQITVYDSCYHYLANNSLFRVNSDTLLVLGSLMDENMKESFFFCLLNNHLDTIYTKTFMDGSGWISFDDVLFLQESQQIIMTGSISHNNTSDKSKLQAFTFLINTQGDSLQFTKYTSSYKTYVKHITPTSDGGYILSGGRNAVGDDYNARWNVIKLDSSLNKQWSYVFSDYGYNSREINDLIATSDGHYVAVGGIGYCSDYTGLTTFSNARLIKFSADQTGLDIIKDTTYAEPWFLPDGSYDTPNTPPCAVDSLVSQGVFKTIKELPDGNFLAIMHYFQNDKSQNNHSILYKLSPDFQILKKYRFNSCYDYWSLIEELNHIINLTDINRN